MQNKSCLKKAVSVFLLLIVVVTMINATVSAKDHVSNNGNSIVELCTGLHGSDTGTTDLGNFKPPKSSFTDYDLFFSCSGFSSLRQSPVSHSYADLHRSPIPGTCSEILIPPEI